MGKLDNEGDLLKGERCLEMVEALMDSVIWVQDLLKVSMRPLINDLGSHVPEVCAKLVIPKEMK